MEVLFENKWCRLILKDTLYVMQSKSDKYKDRYFQSVDQFEAKTGMKVSNLAAQATSVIKSLRAIYKEDSTAFDFRVAQTIAGDHNKELRREIMKQIINETLPLTKCGMYAVSTVLQNHFKQLSIF